MSHVLRVAFHAECLSAGPLTGIGHYAARLLNELARDQSMELLPFFRDTLVPLPITPQPVAAAARRRGPRRAARWMVRSAFRLVPPATLQRRAARRMRAAVQGLRPDVYHEPNNTLVAVGDVPAVLTVHDLSVMRFPHWHPAARVAHFSRHFASSLQRARILLAISNQVKRELTEHLGIPPARIHVTPLAAGEEFRPMPPEAVARTLARFGLQPSTYGLFVGTREPRKNLDALLDAWEALPGATRGGRQLVLVGPAGWNAVRLEERIDRLEKAGSVRRLGYVPDADRPALYAGAETLYYPSLYEGFGLPPLEAAACGTPVVTTTGTPVAASLAGAALIIDPTDGSALNEAVRRSIEDRAWRAQAQAAGPVRAAAYTWAHCAALTRAAYRAAASG